MARPTLRQLSYLIALEQEESFSKAAIYCNVTQSTLSAGIKDLEDILGQQLVNRMGRKITLTSLGNEVADNAKNILSDVDSIVAKAKAQNQVLSSTIRLGVIPTIAPYILPNILPSLQTAYPNLELQIFEDISERLVEKVHKRQLEAAILAFPFDTEGLEHHNLFKEEFYLASPKDKALPKNLSINDIKPEELLLLEEGHCMRDHALAACELQLPSRRKTFSATSLATLIQMVGYGFGVTLLPNMVVKYAPMPDNVALTPFKKPKPTRQVGIVWNINAPQKRDLIQLFEFLRSQLDE
tara:strand:- start:2577 stop:3467 length:891 start_codon:yes stop_codon:yes gene_type:complete